MKSLKRSCFHGIWEKADFCCCCFQNEEICWCYPSNTCKSKMKKNHDLFMMYFTILQSFNFNNKHIKFSVKTVWHRCEFEIWSRLLKVVSTAKLNEKYHYAKFDTDHIYGIGKNGCIKIFVPRWTARWPNTDIT